MVVPKFRAWDTFDGDMVNDIFFSWQDCGYESLNECLSDERWKFMQSTGLVDKNGKEIFEGDVVRVICEHPIDFPDCKGVVRMLEGRYMVCDDKTERCSELFSEIFSNEIIGNIYENPELVEGLDEN